MNAKLTSPKTDLEGERFSRLLVEKQVGKDRSGKIWQCRCDCGSITTANKGQLCSGRKKSCGCYRKEWARDRKITHGRSHRGNVSSIYYIWCGMIQRTTNEKHPAYPDYGGRGISVCDRWRKFENFLSDMGERPEGMSIDRINNDGNYEPGNCRWANNAEQGANKRQPRTAHIISHAGKRMAICKWSKELGINRHTISTRLRRGWPPEKALSISLSSRRSNS